MIWGTKLKHIGQVAVEGDILLLGMASCFVGICAEKVQCRHDWDKLSPPTLPLWVKGLV